MKSISILFSFFCFFITGSQNQLIIQSFDQITDRLIDENGSVSEEYVEELIEQAKDKEVNAQIILGDYYFSLGASNEKSYKNASKYYKKAAKNGNGPAMYRLAYLYENGFGVKNNPNKTVEWLQSSADAGYYLAQFDYGKLLLEDDQLQEGEAYLIQAYQQNFYEAAKILGELYSEGKKTRPIFEQAINWYDKCTYCQYQMKYLRRKINTYDKLSAKLKENPQYISGIKVGIDFDEINELKTLCDEFSGKETVLGKETSKMLRAEVINRHLSQKYAWSATEYNSLLDFQEDVYGFAFLHEEANKGDYYQRIHKRIIALIGLESTEKIRDYNQKVIRYSDELANDLQVKFLEHKFNKSKQSEDYTRISQLLVEEDWLSSQREKYIIKAETEQLYLEDFLAYQSIDAYTKGISNRKQLYSANELNLLNNELFSQFSTKLKEAYKAGHFIGREWFEALKENQVKDLEKAKEREEAYSVYAIREPKKIGFINSVGEVAFYLGEKQLHKIHEGGYQNTYKKEQKQEPSENGKIETLLNKKFAFAESPLIFTTENIYNYNGIKVEIPSLKGVVFEEDFSDQNILASKQGKKGLVNKKGSIVVSFRFEEIRLIENQRFIAIKKDSTYVYSKEGVIQYALATSLNNPQLLAVDSQEYLLNSGENNYEVIDPKTKKQESFEKASHHLISFVESNQRKGFFTFKETKEVVGLKSLTGETIIEPNYSNVYPINANVVFCEFKMDAFPDSTNAKAQTGKLFAIDKKEFISDFHTISHVLNEEKIVCIDDFRKYYTLDIKNRHQYLGKTLIKEPLKDDYFLIRKDSGEGIVDAEGKDYIAAKFPKIYLANQELKDFNVFGLNLPKDKEVKGLFDRAGKVVLRPQFRDIHFYDSLIRLELFSENSRLPDSLEFAYCDLNGKIVYKSESFPESVLNFKGPNLQKSVYFQHLVATYLGEETNGIANGIGLLNATEDYSGHYGEAQIPYTFEGDFKEGIKHGEGQEQYADKSYFEGTFENGAYKIGVLDYGNQERYDGSFKGNLFHGFGKYTKGQEGYVYEGEWKHGEKEGSGKESYKGALWIEGQWKKGKYHGLMSFKFWDLSRVILEFENGEAINAEQYDLQIAQKIEQNTTLKEIFGEEPIDDYEVEMLGAKCFEQSILIINVKDKQMSFLNLIGPPNTKITSEVEQGNQVSQYKFTIESAGCLQGDYALDYNQEFPIINYSNKKEDLYLNGQKEEYQLLLSKEGLHIY